MDKKIDIFLPFWWIAKYPPEGVWENTEVRFNSPSCLEMCTKYEAADFSLTWDEAVAICPEARTIGHMAMVHTETEDPWEDVLEEFQEYLDLMSQEAADALPEHKSYDCRIELKEGEVAPWGPIYSMLEKELKTLWEWLKEMLKSRKICHSTFPARSPILFIPKLNGQGLRLCVDYCTLNRIAIPNRYPLPLMQELQDHVQGAQWFTKMDLNNGFNLIRIREGDEWKTAF